MKNIINVTYPRSGHHFLVDGCLRKLLGNKLNYCETYNHCHKIPCYDKKTNYQKSHDFNFKDPILTDYKYIIQFRHPYESIISHYNLKCSNGRRPFNDNIKNWNSFLQKSIYNWISFMTKWTLQNNNIDKLFVQYYDLVNDTESQLINILNFIDETFDGKILDTIVPVKTSDITKFKYYSKKDLDFVNDKAKFFINKFNIKLI